MLPAHELIYQDDCSLDASSASDINGVTRSNSSKNGTVNGDSNDEMDRPSNSDCDGPRNYFHDQRPHNDQSHGNRAREMFRMRINRAWSRLRSSVWEHILTVTCCTASLNQSPLLEPSCAPGIHPFGYRRLEPDSSPLSFTSSPRTSFVPSNGDGPCTSADFAESFVNTALRYADINSFSLLIEREDIVTLKVGLLGDSETGKSTFMAKYVDSGNHFEYLETAGVDLSQKIFRVQNADIIFSIWDLGGHCQYESMLPMVCRDAVAILIMFDLTRRSTLNSITGWFLQARECNQTAMAIIVGTKYDNFVHLPQNIQFAILQQARVCAHAIGAAGLFFSSAIHNINVHKIFKVIVAKLFDLRCTIPKNLNPREPIIDY